MSQLIISIIKSNRKDDTWYVYIFARGAGHENGVLFQLTFTCLKSTIEIQEKGVKYVQS